MAAYAEGEKAWIQTYGKTRPGLDYFQPAYTPEDHVKLLDQYISTIKSGIIGSIESPSWQPMLQRFDLNPSNIYVREDPTKPLLITSVLDWQHSSILPACIAVKMSSTAPIHFPTYAQIPTQEEGYAPATIPEDVAKSLSPEEQVEAKRDLALANITASYLHISRTRPPIRALIEETPWLEVVRRLHQFAPDCWSHQYLQLRGYLSLMQIGWPEPSISCPLGFAKDVAEYNLFVGAKAHTEFDEIRAKLFDELGADPEGLVPYEKYEAAKARSAELERDWDTKWGMYPLHDGRWSQWLR